MADARLKGAKKRQTPAGDGHSGLEAGIIFLMIIVFLGLLFINGISSPSEIENNIVQARSYMDHGEFAAAAARLDEVLRKFPAHEAAAELKAEAEHRMLEQQRVDDEAKHSMQTDLASARAGLASARAEIEIKDTRITEVSGNLAKAYTEVASLQNRLAQANARQRETMNEVAEARSEVAAKSTELADRERASSQELASRDRQVAELTRDLESTRTRLADAEKKERINASELNSTRRELEDKRAALAGLERRVMANASRLDELLADLDQAKEYSSRFNRGAEKLLAEAKRLEKAGEHTEALARYRSYLLLFPGDEAATRGADGCEKAIEEARKQAEPLPEAPAPDAPESDEDGI